MFAMLLKERRENSAGNYIRKISRSVRRFNETENHGNAQVEWAAVQWQRGVDRFSRPLSNESGDGLGSTITSGNAAAVLRSSAPAPNGDPLAAGQQLMGEAGEHLIHEMTSEPTTVQLQHHQRHQYRNRSENRYSLVEVGNAIVELLGHPVHHPYIDDSRYSEQSSNPSPQCTPTRFGPRNSKDRRMLC